MSFKATTRAALISAALRNERGADDGVSLIAQTIRRVVATRIVVLRRALVGEVFELIAPVLRSDDLIDAIDTEIEALADLGDLLLRRPADRAPVYVEHASGSLVMLEERAGFLVLGRLEAALPGYVREKIRTRGRLRLVPYDAIGQAVVDELEFQGCSLVDWRNWSQIPEPVPATLLLSRMLERGTRYAGDGTSFDVFDPMSVPWFFNGRFKSGALQTIVERYGWAAGRSEGSFGQRSFSLFGSVAGELRRAEVPRESFMQIVGACARNGGGPLVARRNDDQLRLHFLPPPWLRRLLSMAAPIERLGALVAVELPSMMIDHVAPALEAVLFCDIRTDEGEWR